MFSLSWKILHIVAFLIGNSSLRGEGIECWPWSPDLVSCVGWVCFWSLSLLQVYYNINNVVKNSFLVTPGSERVCLSSTTTSINWKKGLIWWLFINVSSSVFIPNLAKTMGSNQSLQGLHTSGIIMSFFFSFFIFLQNFFLVFFLKS